MAGPRGGHMGTRLRGRGTGAGEHWTGRPAGQEDTSMMLIMQRHTSTPKPLLLKFLTVRREGQEGKE